MIQRLFVFLFLVCFIPQFAEAGKVLKTKGKKVYLLFDQSEGGTFAEGDFFELTGENGKKRGLVEIKKVKGLKAIGLLKKGKAAKGNGLSFKSEGKKKSKKLVADVEEEAIDTEESSSSSPGQFRWGGQLGYGMTSQDVNQGNTTSAQSGSTMAIKGLMDYPIFNSLSLRGSLGVEMMSVSGEGKKLGQTVIETVGTDITYASLDALIKWNVYSTSSMNFYLLGGAGIFFPVSKSSDLIDEATIDQLGIGEFGAGFDFQWGTYVIPIDVSYYYFPTGEDVTTNIISVKIGILF